jgi:hypothetical protein
VSYDNILSFIILSLINWLSCVLKPKDAALFTGVDNVSIEAAEQEAGYNGEVSYVGTRSFSAAQATPTTRSRPFKYK